MSQVRSTRAWYQVHKWTSLVCTLFLLVVCASGLPLVFSHEIEEWLADDPPYASLPPDAPRASLDAIVQASRARYPHEAVRFVFTDDAEPQVVVTMSPTTDSDPALNHTLKFDARTGALLRDAPPAAQRQTFMGVMRRLHVDLFAGLAGELFLAAMGALFVASVVSGVVLYGPFMRKLAFGTVRRGRARRLKWLDLHNLVGIATLAWALVVGATGVVNELATPLFQLWRATAVEAQLAPWQGRPMPAQRELASTQAAYDAVRRAMPHAIVTSVVFPTERFGSPHHYMIWTKGDTTLTSRLFVPAIVDARTGALDKVFELPWYLTALEVSRPLHFGDYAGLPLKVIWALLDLVTIVVLGSGLYLWVVRHRSARQRVEAPARRHKAPRGAAGRAS